MKKIDLHVHSNVSDGTYTPTEVVQLAKEAGLAAFALTDHDTTAGVQEALDAAQQLTDLELPLEVIPGVEISVGYKDRDIHMLGLMIDHKNEELVRVLDKVQDERVQRNVKMVKNLADAGIDISIEKLTAQEKEGTVLTRAHFARYLALHGYAKDIREAFSKYLEIDGAYYVHREYITPEHAIRLIRDAGGIPILAHPLLYKLPEEELEALVKRLAEHGLGGVEAIYSSNTPEDERYVRRLAEKYNLMISGGTDFHGTNKPHLRIGTGHGDMQIPYEILEKLRNCHEIN